MKPHLQCAEQQVSRSNLTKYCACHAERLAYLVLITYETSFTMTLSWPDHRFQTVPWKELHSDLSMEGELAFHGRNKVFRKRNHQSSFLLFFATFSTGRVDVGKPKATMNNIEQTPLTFPPRRWYDYLGVKSARFIFRHAVGFADHDFVMTWPSISNCSMEGTSLWSLHGRRSGVPWQEQSFSKKKSSVKFSSAFCYLFHAPHWYNARQWKLMKIYVCSAWHSRS